MSRVVESDAPRGVPGTTAHGSSGRSAHATADGTEVEGTQVARLEAAAGAGPGTAQETQPETDAGTAPHAAHQAQPEAGENGPEQLSPEEAERRAQVMAERYGTVDHKRRRRGLWVLIGALSTVGIAVLVMIGVGFFAPDANGQRVGFEVVDDTEVRVLFDVTKPEDSTASCTLEALNVGYGQVGLREIVIGPQDQHTVRVRETVATTEKATTGLVRDCRLIDG